MPTEELFGNYHFLVRLKLTDAEPLTAELRGPAVKSGTPRSITDGTSNTIMFNEVRNHPSRLQPGFGLLLPASSSPMRFLPGMSVPKLLLLPYMEQDNLYKSASVPGIQVQGVVSSVSTAPDGSIEVLVQPQGIIAVLIGL